MENKQKVELSELTPALTAVKISGGKFIYPQHIAYIDRLISKAAENPSGRLIINLPPRHGKSELISKYFPFWYLCRYPDKRIILSSYEATFAQSWGRKVKQLIEEFGYELAGIKLSGSSHSAGHFEIDGRAGSMTCVGAGGPITGKGADLFIIDDPVKNDEEANSSSQREKLWDWFRSTAYTRLEPDGTMIVMMTRWHEDDLCGRIIENWDSEDGWEIVKIPAIAQNDDLLGRKPGSPLWSRRFSCAKLEKLKKELGSYWFESLYQQNPVNIGGGIFKKTDFRYFYIEGDNYVLQNGEHTKTINKQSCTNWTAVDLAISLSSSADYTVAITVAISEDNKILVIDVVRKRISPAEHLELVQSLNDKHSPRLIGIESVQYQSALVQNAASCGFPVKALKPDTDKLTRALPVASKFENGMIFFDKDAKWLPELESELMKFPRDKHDDQVDALAYVCMLINPITGILPKSSKSKR
ncbi:MAG: phage terminase large subunit [Candidatus Kapabacteria bacterium]|nr:phage terminase large subunit [Ignavibacteriota bacterium]MCW5885607.1 phage terminase large subunit [Candidatus Kapabacteria bacterium]